MIEGSDCLLAVKGITVRFGGIIALDGVSFDVPRNKVCGLIGPNGAGKTTLFNCLSRLYAYQEGDLLFEGRSITHTPVHQMATIGIGRTFQNLAMFKTMSVRQNVMVGAHARSSSGFVANMLKLGHVKQEAEQMHERVRREFWAYARDENLTNEQRIAEDYAGIRPAPGYPAQPDHTEKQTLFDLLAAERRIGVKLTESCAMWPGSTVSGLYIAQPESFYFGVAKVERDQVEDYAARKGMARAEVERWLGVNLGYEVG